jgi:glutaconate CoA-transferase subunit B
VCIGPHDKPKLRGPGTVGISALTALARRFYVVMARHDRGSFPERVDFLNGPGFLDGGTSRTDRGLPEGGPKMVLSPFGVFDFEPVSKRMRVMSLNPGVTSEQVQKQTGFELVVDGTPPVTSMPSAEELRVLRESVDSTGVLRDGRRA